MKKTKIKQIKEISETNKISSTGNGGSSHTDTVLEAVTLVASNALVIEPVNTVLEFALSLNQLIFIRTSLTITSTVFHTSLNFTNSSLQLVMRKTVFAHSLLISETSLSNRLAFSVNSQVVSAFTGNTSIVVQDSALLDFAVLAVQGEW